MAIPKLFNNSIFSGRPARVKIDFKALPITAPPRAVLCCKAVIADKVSLRDTPASCAVLPTRDKPSAKSSVETAKALSKFVNLSTKSPELLSSLENVFIAAVIASTAFVASIPAILVRVKASLVLLNCSSKLKP